MSRANAFRFARLQDEAAIGNAEAVARLAWHVQRRLASGMRLSTVAAKMNMTVENVQRYAAVDRK